MKVPLHHVWTLGQKLKAGGFGQVFEAQCSDNPYDPAVAKLVPKAPGAKRELLFANTDGVRNIIPIIDSGETTDHWVLVMPRAEKSLREFLVGAGDKLEVSACIDIMVDIATALCDMDGKIIHRDLKPENILFFKGKWCLADFGISRYADATTSIETQKYAMTGAYAAPEQWRSERATTAADVYALGIIGYELLAGRRPFIGPSHHQFREQHLHENPPSLDSVPAALRALIMECLFKSPMTRPSPANLLARLEAARQSAPSIGRARLREINDENVVRMSRAAQQASVLRSEEDLRREALRDGKSMFAEISGRIKAAILSDAPTATIQNLYDGGWTATINGASLSVSGLTPLEPKVWKADRAPAFTVIACSALAVRIPANRYDYDGRAHSLWFGDIQEEGRFCWFEVGFMIMPLMRERSRIVPFALGPGEDAAQALSPGLGKYQLARPFTPLTHDQVDDFVDRWIGWLAEGAQGQLQHPSHMPEIPPDGSWRK